MDIVKWSAIFSRIKLAYNVHNLYTIVILSKFLDYKLKRPVNTHRISEVRLF